MICLDFLERVRQEAIVNAAKYKRIFVDYQYLVYSGSFSRKFYIVNAHEDNYLHLVGVGSSLNPTEFFFKSLNGSLELSDINLHKGKKPEKDVKGSVRRKINSLPYMMNIFSDGMYVEENFVKNNVSCSFATSDETCTLGFIGDELAKPMTLMKNNQLSNRAVEVELVLSKKNSDKVFDTIVVGNNDILLDHKCDIPTIYLDKSLLVPEPIANPVTL